jgi:hypothetical protein
VLLLVPLEITPAGVVIVTVAAAALLLLQRVVAVSP